MVAKNLAFLLPILLGSNLFISNFSHAEPVVLDTVNVQGERMNTGESSEETLLQSGDPSSSLYKLPGVHLATGGGISSLPVVRGFNDDRLATSINGAKITSACANHMNPTLSYIDPLLGSQLELKRGLLSVADFYDAIGDSIVLNPSKPTFSKSADSILTEGKLSTNYRSNGDGTTASLLATMATDDIYVSYVGSHNQSDSYDDGDGNKVFSTQYESITNSLRVSKQFADHLSTLNVSTQKILYQGFVNQYMDMVDNLATTVSLNDKGNFDWGVLDSTVFFQNTEHEMGFFSKEKEGQMPMNTVGNNFGYAFKGEIPVAGEDVLRIGTDYYRFNLSDKWPAVPGSMMMGPDTFVNINDGHKQIIGNYAEIKSNPSKEWSLIAGVRYNLVHMNTGDVQPYTTGQASMGDDMGDGGMGMGMHSMKMMGMGPDLDIVAAEMFNDRDRSQTDHNIGVNLQAKYEPDLRKSVEFGYTRKVRSPNLYERYAWGRNTMAMTMIGWFGDANGYVGDIDLQPEVAHTISTTVSLHDETQDVWKLSATPYASYVEDFIDVDSIGTFNPRMSMTETRQLLKFANHDAKLYGFDLDGDVRVLHDNALGDVRLKSLVSMVQGSRVGTGTNLYRMMPLNARLGAEHKLGDWESLVELQLVSRKSKVDPFRDEPETSGFAVMNLQTGYTWKRARLDFGLTNLFDTYYELPLGGVDYATFAAGSRDTIGAVRGPGRSINVGVTFFF